jgi:hypothetical protein
MFWYEIAGIQRITLAQTAALTSVHRTEAAISSTALANFYQTTQHHISRLVSMMCGWPVSTLFWTLETQTNYFAVILKHSYSAPRLWNILSQFHTFRVT